MVDRYSQSIVLIGMMGAGKSSVGRCLRRRMGSALIDTDQMVASRFRMSLAQIFAEHGEKKFREAEAEALRSVPITERTITVTGGGIVLRKENVEILKHLGLIVWLDGDDEALFSRASRKQNRPLLQTKKPRKTFSQILSARRPFYARIADFRVDTSQLTAEEVAIGILSKLGRLDGKPGSSVPATTL